MPLVTIKQIFSDNKTTQITQVNPQFAKFFYASTSQEIGKSILYLNGKKIFGAVETVEEINDIFKSCGSTIVARNNKEELGDPERVFYICMETVLTCAELQNDTYRIEFIDGSCIFVDKPL